MPAPLWGRPRHKIHFLGCDAVLLGRSLGGQRAVACFRVALGTGNHPSGRGSEAVSGDGGPLELDHLAEDRQPCHPEHRGGRCHPGGAQPRRQHAVVRKK